MDQFSCHQIIQRRLFIFQCNLSHFIADVIDIQASARLDDLNFHKNLTYRMFQSGQHMGAICQI